MLTKTKIALAAALSPPPPQSRSAEEFDPNLGNRYPGYNGPVAATQSIPRACPACVRSRWHCRASSRAPVRLQNQRTAMRPKAQHCAAVRRRTTFHYEQRGYPRSPSGGGY